MNDFTNPMKAQPFRPNKMVYPCFAQPKINGVRCVAHKIKSDDLFNESTFILQSKEGIVYPIQHIIRQLNCISTYCDISNTIFDGEIYLPNTKCTSIAGAARNSNNFLHNKLQFIIFDIVNENTQYHRNKKLESISNFIQYAPIDEHHLWKATSMYILESYICNNDEEAKEYRNKFITLDFEGVILRKTSGLYECGKRSHNLLKYKKHEFELFKVVDIIPKPIDTHLPLFICKNDISDDLFECVPTGTHTKQALLLQNKHLYIGTEVTVKYYERTINNLPFHANVITDEL